MAVPTVVKERFENCRKNKKGLLLWYVEVPTKHVGFGQQSFGRLARGERGGGGEYGVVAKHAVGRCM